MAVERPDHMMIRIFGSTVPLRILAVLALLLLPAAWSWSQGRPAYRVATAAPLADRGSLASAALSDLLNGLKSDDPRLRAAAAKAISFAGDAISQVVPALVAALSDPSPETRFEAAFALGQIGPMPGPAIAALRKSLADTGRIVETLPSGAELTGSVRIAAAEALLNLGEENLAVIRQYGGDIRKSDAEEPELPWLSGRQLRLSADETDIRELIAVILRANQMTVSFRRDIEGFLTFNFEGMPMQGAFNMLLHEFDLSYQWDEQRRHVAMVPFGSVYFPAGTPEAAALASLRKVKTGGGKNLPGGGAKLTTARPAKKSVAFKFAANPAKTVAPHKKIVVTGRPQPTNHTKAELKLNQSGPTPKSAVPANGEEKPPARIVATKPAAPAPRISSAAETFAKETVKGQGQSSSKRTAAREPAARTANTETLDPIDLSKAHKLSFIIKYDGLYRAMIEGREYTAGMTIITAHGEMVIVDIRKRIVHLVRNSANGAEEFVIRHRRRRAK